MEIQKQVTDLLTTIETTSNYAREECGKWKPEDNTNFTAEAFFHVIHIMAKEAKGWVQIAATTGQ